MTVPRHGTRCFSGLEETLCQRRRNRSSAKRTLISTALRRIVLSTMPQSLPMRTLKQRGVREVKLGGMENEQKKQAAVRFLELSKKTLEDDVLGLIVDAAQTVNPLFLRLTLEELKARLHTAALQNKRQLAVRTQLVATRTHLCALSSHVRPL